MEKELIRRIEKLEEKVIAILQYLEMDKGIDWELSEPGFSCIILQEETVDFSSILKGVDK